MKPAEQIKCPISPYVTPGIRVPVNKSTVDGIIDETCKFFNIPVADIYKKSRRREIVEPRQICMYLMTMYGGITLAKIGKLFGRDHTTVIHTRQSVQNYIDTDPVFKEKVFHIKYKCGL